MRKRIVFALLLAALFASGTASAKPRKVKVEFDRAPMIEVVRYFSELLDRNFVVADAVYEARVTILSGRPVTLEEAWDAFLTAADTERIVIEEAGRFWVVKRRLSRRPPPRPRTAVEAEEPAGEASRAASCGLGEVTADESGKVFALQRAGLDAALGRAECIVRQARAVPLYRDGAVVGFKLYAIRPSSFYHALGFRNGDIVLAVAGRALESPDAALAAYEAARQADEVEVELERRGERRVHVYRIARGEEASP